MNDDTGQKILGELRQIRIGVMILVGVAAGLALWLNFLR